jgi:hypothetical protein
MKDFRSLWSGALTFEQFLAASAPQHTGLWEGIYNLARLPDWSLDAVAESPPLRLLVLTEDWCGDAANTVPVLAKWADHAATIELRLLRRDEHPELMDRYLTNNSRSIPIVIVLDAENNELGSWGPRPAELQAWVMANKGIVPKAELYPQVRRWYSRDRGVSTLREVLAAAGVQADLDPAA